MSKLVTLQSWTAEVREETLDERTYLVAPVVAVINGVLNRKYLSADEILSVPIDLWNDIPLPVAHPEEGSGSARDVDVIENRVVGRFYNARYETSGDDVKLKGELWVDIEKAVGIGADGTAVVNRLRDGQPLEVSTAYFNDEEDKPGVFNGEPYDYIAHNLKPDHLALLPAEIGACSWADGCGAPRTNAKEKDMLVGNLMKGESYSEREKSVLDAIREKEIQEAEESTWIWIADLYEDSVVYSVTKDNMDEGYFQASYTIGADGNAVIGESVGVEREIVYTVAQNKETDMKQNQCETGILNKIKRMLGVNTMNREEMVAELVSGGIDESVFEGASDELISALHERSQKEEDEEVTPPVDQVADPVEPPVEHVEDAVAEPVVNAETVIEGVKLGEIARFIKNRNSEAEAEQQGLVDSLVANERCTISKESLESMSPCALKELVANFAPGNYAGVGIPRGKEQTVPTAPAVVLRKVGE